jgi:hypothetical protein
LRNVVNYFNLYTPCKTPKPKKSIFFPWWKSEIKNYPKFVSRQHICQKETVQLGSSKLNYVCPKLFFNVILIVMQYILHLILNI